MQTTFAGLEAQARMTVGRAAGRRNVEAETDPGVLD